MSILKPVLILLASGVLLSVAPVFALGEMPRLQFVSGDVEAVNSEGVKRSVRKGDILSAGEKLITAKGAMAQLRLFGQGIVALREGSEIEITPPENGHFDIKLDKGIVRTVTNLPKVAGQIKVATGQAVYSVRGGDMQTANQLPGKPEDSANLAIAGDVKVNARGKETVIQPGKAVRVNLLDGNMVRLANAPEALLLKQPLNSRVSDQGKPAIISRKGDPVAKLPLTTKITAPQLVSIPQVPRLALATPVQRLAVPLVNEPALTKTYNFELTRLNVGSANNLDASSKTALNDSFVLVLGSNTGKTPTVQPITTTTSPVLKTTLTTLATRTTVVEGGTGSTTDFIVKDPVLSPRLKLTTGRVSGGSLFLRR